MFTNLADHGGSFLKVVEDSLKSADRVRIASGYTSLDILQKFKSEFERIASKGGKAQLLLGMALYEGLSKSKLELLKELSKNLEACGGESGVFVTFTQRYHGKVYEFEFDDIYRTYVGSSNFSRSGLVDNMEATTLISDELERAKVSSFLDHLFDNSTSVSILQAEIVIPGTQEYRAKINLSTLDDLKKYDVSTIDESQLEHFVVDLRRNAKTEKSNLNVYFGKGRLDSSTGKIAPRPWYEIEVICPKTLTEDALYPKGDFLAYTDDGFIMPMKTSGTNNKNLRSRGNLKLLGMWIKGKLQKSQALLPLTPVTLETLDAYGKDRITFYKIDMGKYYMEF